MAKKKKGKKVQMLSPENYIRKKARSLPVYECLVNLNWEQSRMVDLIIARKHTNGNITAGIYLVDLWCLGVKDTGYFFNDPEFRYQERMAEWKEEMEFTKIDYALAHNIVYAAVEFAEEYGFKPHKDFSSVSSYILEEDTDDIELIEIECGSDGKPSYMQGPNDSEEQKNKIIAQLEKTAGPGNYHFTTSASEFMEENDEDFEEDEGDEQYDELEGTSSEELINRMIHILNKQGKPEKADFQDLVNISDILLRRMADNDLADNYYDEISESFEEVEILSEEIPHEMLGADAGDPTITDEIKEQFVKILRIDPEKKSKLKKSIKKFKKMAGEITASHFLDLKLFESENPDDIETIENYAKQFPDYPLLQLRYLIQKMAFSQNTPVAEDVPFDLLTFFRGRKKIQEYELLDYLTYQIFSIKSTHNISKIIALDDVLYDKNLEIEHADQLYALVAVFKLNFTMDQLIDKNELNHEI